MNKNIVCIFPEQILPIFLVFWPLLFVPASYYCIRFSIVHFFAVFGRTVIFFSSFYSLKLHHIRELMLPKKPVKIKINLQKVESFGVHFHFLFLLQFIRQIFYIRFFSGNGWIHFGRNIVLTDCINRNVKKENNAKQ